MVGMVVMAYRILIMGLPGSGKTTLAAELVKLLEPDVFWFNADAIREQFNDWDFSEAGRLRQASRMRELADASAAKFVIADFVCPLPAMRDIYHAHIVVWVDTIESGRFSDTNQMFVAPEQYDCRVTTQDAVIWATLIRNQLLARS